MNKFKELFENKVARITEAKIKDETNTAITAIFKKAFNGKKILFKEDGNTLVITIKETEPNTSHNKLNEYDLERAIEAAGGKMKMDRRQQSGKEVFNSGEIEDIQGKRRLAWSFKDTSKFRTSTIKIF